MTPDPDQYLLDGRRLGDVEAERLASGRRNERARNAGPRVRAREEEAHAWLAVFGRGELTIAELARAWWPDEVGEPGGWRLGSYPVGRIRDARRRVTALRYRGWVSVRRGVLRHQRRIGVLVKKVSG